MSPALPPWRSLWAKSEPCHPLWCHLIDAGAVAEQLIEVLGELWLDRLADRWGKSRDEVRALVVILTAVHDIGKASAKFQQKWNEGKLAAQGAGFRFLPQDSAPSAHPHGMVSATWLWEHLWQEEPVKGQLATGAYAAQCSGSHHGVILSPCDISPRNKCKYDFEKNLDPDFWEAARHGLWHLLLRLFNNGKTPTIPSQGLGHELAWIDVMGFISCADWIASSSEYFADGSMATSTEEPADYLARVQHKAKFALQTLGWTTPPPIKAELQYAELFPHLKDKDLRPLQKEVKDCFDITDPRLLIIEAPMGEGKTEAALYAATAWIRQGVATGAYVALPTQATGNAMFNRLVNWIEAIHPDGTVGTALVHAGLEKGELYGQLRMKGIYDGGSQGEERRGSRVDGWFMSSKQGILALYGAGTIDQALLAALRCRHHFVRFHGLARKVVIFDEVHAYDAYTGKLLDRLIELLVAYGARVVVLSATLPPTRRKELLEAAGASIHPKDYKEYPCLHAVEDSEKMIMRSFSSESRQPIHLNWLRVDNVLLIKEIGERLEHGGCAAAIFNTVSAAQDFYMQCAAALPTVELYIIHSRYPAGERQRREQTLLQRFGRDATLSNGKRPHRALVIGTQVLEQSLDLDFDLMATQIAPVDLVLQRVGRLFRHVRSDRPKGVSAPVLLLQEPESDSSSAPNYDASEKVYDRSILLRSHAALRAKTVLCLPKDIANLIDFVYEQHSSHGLPEAWGFAFIDARKTWESETRTYNNLAEGRLLPSVNEMDVYLDDPLNDHDDHEGSDSALAARTRLGPPSLLAICVHLIDGEIYLDDSPDAEPLPQDTFPSPLQVRELFRRTVPISSRPGRHAWESPPDTDFDRIKQSRVPEAWRQDKVLRHLSLLPFQNRQYELGNYSLTWDPELGIVRQFYK